MTSPTNHKRVGTAMIDDIDDRTPTDFTQQKLSRMSTKIMAVAEKMGVERACLGELCFEGLERVEAMAERDTATKFHMQSPPTPPRIHPLSTTSDDFLYPRYHCSFSSFITNYYLQPYLDDISDFERLSRPQQP